MYTLHNYVSHCQLFIDNGAGLLSMSQSIFTYILQCKNYRQYFRPGGIERLLQKP